jgi:threonylcarbamoyladenosine tRNA methylthiotransferase MtaB
MEFSRMHVFKYSPRSGTPAAEMDDQVHSKVVGERSRRLRELADEMMAEWAQRFVGREVRVLLEGKVDDDFVRGYTDRYVETHVRAGDDVLDTVRWVTGEESRDGRLIAHHGR